MHDLTWDEWAQWKLDGSPPGYTQPYDSVEDTEFVYPIRNDDWCRVELVLPGEKKGGLFKNIYIKRLTWMVVMLAVAYYLDWLWVLGVAAVFWFKYLLLPGFYMWQDLRMQSASGDAFALEFSGPT